MINNIEKTTTISEKRFIPILCLIWHHTIVRVVEDGIEIRCKSCRGAIHHISREQLEKEWTLLNTKESIPA